MRDFPEAFRLDPMKGARRASFEKPDDAFQQLVGDWVRELDAQALVTSTAGQDGSIDHWMECKRLDAPLLAGAAFPLIIECKWHSEASDNHAANILKGWAAVEEKLKKQADAGWPNLYAPWRRARGYLYCISGRLPNQQARDDLKGRIEGFFRSLPDGRRPPIDWVEVVDWSMLRSAFNGHARLRDGWLGIGVEALLDHATVEAGLRGVRAYLKSETLAFIPPPEEAPEHPQRILAELQERANEGGVLLIGPGGIGKTRTAMEVARLALAGGWRVLHTASTGGEGGPDISAIKQEVLPGLETTPVLLIVDYLEQHRSLRGNEELRALRDQLLVPAAARGGRVAVLAMARPGTATLNDNEWKTFFVTHEIAPAEERRERIAQAMIRTAAPQACIRFGMDLLAEIVGRRPIIALFVAREIERRLASGHDTLQELIAEARQTGPDLRRWLESRLREDELLPPPAPTTGLLRRAPPPDGPVIAVMAMLAAAPLARTKMPAVAASVLQAAGGGDEADAAYLCDLLHRMGWLEDEAGYSVVAHDVVADELVERCLFEPAAPRIRSEVLENLLEPGLRDVRVLGRIATAFVRAFASAEPPVRDALEQACASWLDRRSADFTRLLREDKPSTVAYAVGALLDSPFASPLFAQWESLFGPWLAGCATVVDSRHLLRAALKHAPAGHFHTISDALFRWIDAHGSSPVASHVLAPLLERSDLDDPSTDLSIRYGLSWLTAHGLSPEARFVLPPLIGRPELSGECLEVSVTHVLSWLTPYGRSLEAGFVLRPLLRRPELSGEQFDASVAHGLSWLAEHGRSLKARFVLHALLERSELSGERLEALVADCLSWLTENGRSLEAGFVLRSLLGRPELSGEQFDALVAHGLAWLAEHGRSLEAGFVLPPLLGNSELTGRRLEASVAHGLSWLAEHGRSPKARFVLHALLERSELSGERLEALVADCLSWLTENGRSLEAEFVLLPLIRHSELLGERLEAVVVHVLSWLTVHGRALEAWFVLHTLFERWERSGERLEAVVAHGLSWLAAHGRTLEAGSVLPPLLGRPELSGECLEASVAYGLSWLTVYGRSLEAGFVLPPLLGRLELSGERLEMSVAYALTWLTAHGRSLEAGFVLSPLIRRLNALSSVTSVVEKAISWLSYVELRSEFGASFVISEFLEKIRYLDDGVQESIVEISVNWIAMRSNPGEIDFVASRLLRTSITSLEQWRSVAARAIAALSAGVIDNPAFMVSALLTRPDVFRQQATRRWLMARFLMAVQEGTAIPDTLPRAMGFRLIRTLHSAAVRKRSFPALTAAVCRFFERIRWSGEEVDGYGNFIAPLLPLAHRSGDSRLCARAQALAARLLAAEGLTDDGREIFLFGCEALLDRGAWEHRETGLAALRRLVTDWDERERPVRPAMRRTHALASADA
ncbi:hypothetical protein ACCD06_07625 [Azospirillum sp. CT11-132]|uniref:hypothetical protein n=1 Tax=Azospirillum sp. CT11-132 TaxID=3396317 RepID=UPI0039A66183